MFDQTVSDTFGLAKEEFDLSAHSFRKGQGSGSESKNGNICVGNALSEEERRQQCNECSKENSGHFTTHIDGLLDVCFSIVIMMMVMRMRMAHVHAQLSPALSFEGRRTAVGVVGGLKTTKRSRCL